ncbi:DUF4166 domain-containing protein [Serinibacter arcticus]|uniref:DUF4166 domain-containing protein n=1 Tax=Serinibacter arcticus TaxID=1655435 RepID=A0A2U1ZSK2_9MICO|nr:DUF4166 domain-containing protein [Serinibacter arcticus]PWD49930.1 DUF4166 domain-containing protein [Serinibacter arcticus]
MPSTPRSPYAAALGPAIERLHPSLQRYFATIPPGHRGVGEGVFDTAGTPRRWLWPLLRLVQPRGVVFAGWERDVPFRIVNRTVGGSAVAVRELDLPDGTWVMRDDVVRSPAGGVTDRLGSPVTLAATFDVAVDGDALVLTSRTLGVALGPLRFAAPRRLSPVVRLRESFDAASGHQRVDLAVDHPLLGRLYGYGGLFTYRIEKEIS